MNTKPVFTFLALIATFAIGRVHAQDMYGPVTASFGDCGDCSSVIEQSVPVRSRGLRGGGLRGRGMRTGSGASTCGSAAPKYFSIFGGGLSLDDLELNAGANIPGTGVFDAEAVLDMNEGYGIGGAFGRRLGRWFRTELEFAYRSASANNATIDVQGPVPNALGPLVPIPPLPPGLGINIPQVPGVTTPLPLPNFPINAAVGGRLNTYSIMNNLLIDLNQGPTKIYGGAGFGVMFSTLEVNESTTPIDFSLETSSFVYQGIAGVSHSMTPNVDIFAEYRFIGTGSQKFEGSSPLGTAYTDADVTGHNYFVGLRLNRW